MKKTLVALLLILVLTASLAACGGGASTPTPPAGAPSGSTAAPSASGKIKVYLITMDSMDAYWMSIKAGCEEAVAEIGADKVEFIMDSPEKKDDAAQIEKINNAVANNANYILLAANSPDAQNGAVQDAANAGVKIIYVDAPASWEGALATITTDNKAAGKLAGETLIAALAAAGTTGGKIGIVNVNAATASTSLREEGFRSAFAGKADFEILEVQYGDGDSAKSQELAANFITQGVVGLFGCNEGSTVGVANAIKEAGGSVLGAGFDTGGSVLDLIDGGFLVCTMAQNPGQMGYLGVQNAYTDSTGGTIAEPNVDSGVTVVDKSNVASFR